MSLTAAHQRKALRRHCLTCQDRKARFRYRGHVRADRDHTLCFECFRGERDRQRAKRLAAMPPPAAVRVSGTPAALPGPASVAQAPLTTRQVAHRERMLAHLAVAIGAGR